MGYVGLPLAEAFSKHFRVIGFDVDEDKLAKLKKDGVDLELTSNSSNISKADFVIIAVPTPITKSKQPDLSHVISAAEIVGRNLKRGAIIVSESTVLLGVTEEIIGPILEKESGLKLRRDFKVRIPPVY